MADTSYSVGTVTVANGGTTVTGVGTAWAGKVFAGELFTDPAQGLFARVTADAISDTSLSINPWPGTALSGDAYEILFMSDGIRQSERSRQLLDQLSVVQANGRGLFYRFDDTITDSDPGAGLLRLNNAAPGSATAAFLDNLDADGGTVSAVLDTWDDTGSTDGRGQLWLRSVAEPATFHAFDVTGAVVDGTGYRKLTLEYVGGAGSFAAGDELMVMFLPLGQGLTGKSAYEIAVDEGFVGDEAAWLASLEGIDGVDGKFSGTEIVKTAAYTALAADDGKTIILNKATPDTLSFDDVATLGANWMVIVKNIGVGTWTLEPDGAETIDGAANLTLAHNSSVVVSSNGTGLRSLLAGGGGGGGGGGAEDISFDNTNSDLPGAPDNVQEAIDEIVELSTAAKISFNVQKSANQTMAASVGSYQIITFNSENWDEGGYFNTTTGRWTPPAGRYEVQAFLTTGAGTAASAFGLAVLKNGGAIAEASRPIPTAGVQQSFSINCLVEADGDDYFELGIAHASGTTFTVFGSQYTVFSGFQI